MILKYTQNQFDNSKSRETLPLECERCHNEFHLQKYVILKITRGQTNNTGSYCSLSCSGGMPALEVDCKNCGVKFMKQQKEIKKKPNHFCSRSCAATHNNKNKTTGNRRSKLEAWLEEKLQAKYTDLEIHFNRKDAINSELDIFIPSMKLAFELNGIFHYEPIYGEQKLSQIQNNDHRKFQACAEHGISLCIIDSSSQKYFTEKTSAKYLEIIESIIRGTDGI